MDKKTKGKIEKLKADLERQLVLATAKLNQLIGGIATCKTILERNLKD